MALEADSMTGGGLDEGLKGGCMGIMLSQENATEPLGKHAHSSAHQTHTAARSNKAAFGDILNKDFTHGRIQLAASHKFL